LAPNITITSIMACQIFRDLTLGRFVDPMAEGEISKIVFRDMAAVPQQPSGSTYELRTFNDTATDIGGAGRQMLGTP
jgi:hypothetical protein